MAEGPTDGESYTAQEAAKILRTTERTIRRRLERGDLELPSGRALLAHLLQGGSRSMSL